jgi:hypothetical protein
LWRAGRAMSQRFGTTARAPSTIRINTYGRVY